MNAVIYVRVSSEEQVQGTSLETQNRQCHEYCLARGFTVLAVFKEEGVSAKTADRVELLRAIEFCRRSNNTVHAFVVAKVDRFARNTEDHFSVRNKLREAGATLHSVSEPIGNSPTEKFLETMLAASAEFDNAIRKQRCTDGMKARLDQGIWPFNPPAGYEAAGSKRRGEKKLRPDPPHPLLFAIVQSSLKAYAAGTLRSLQQLADHLNAGGFASAGRRLATAQLADRMTGSMLWFYAGKIRNPWTGAVMQGQHVAMLTGIEMQSIADRRLGRLRAVVRNRSNPLFPLRRTVRCSACDRWVTGSTSRGRYSKYAYYHCCNSSCTQYGKVIAKTKLEAAFLAVLKRLSPTATNVGLIAEILRRQTQYDVSAAQERLTKLTGRRAAILARRSRILEMREDGTYSKNQCDERRAVLEIESAQVEESIAELRNGPKSITLAPEVLSLIATLPDTWLALPAEMKERFQQIVFPNGIPFGRISGFGTSDRPLLLSLFEANPQQVSRVVDLEELSWNRIFEEYQRIEAFVNDLAAVKTTSTIDACIAA